MGKYDAILLEVISVDMYFLIIFFIIQNFREAMLYKMIPVMIYKDNHITLTAVSNINYGNSFLVCVIF